MHTHSADLREQRFSDSEAVCGQPSSKEWIQRKLLGSRRLWWAMSGELYRLTSWASALSVLWRAYYRVEMQFLQIFDDFVYWAPSLLHNPVDYLLNDCQESHEHERYQMHSTKRINRDQRKLQWRNVQSHECEPPLELFFVFMFFCINKYQYHVN